LWQGFRLDVRDLVADRPQPLLGESARASIASAPEAACCARRSTRQSPHLPRRPDPAAAVRSARASDQSRFAGTLADHFGYCLRLRLRLGVPDRLAVATTELVTHVHSCNYRWPTPSIAGIRPARQLSRGKLPSRPIEHRGRI
jgi:hypothetical protein